MRWIGCALQGLRRHEVAEGRDGRDAAAHIDGGIRGLRAAYAVAHMVFGKGIAVMLGEPGVRVLVHALYSTAIVACRRAAGARWSPPTGAARRGVASAAGSGGHHRQPVRGGPGRPGRAAVWASL